MSYVFFGGMRGTAWVNAFQTVLFLSFGAVALVVIGRGMGGFPAAMDRSRLARLGAALTRERFSPLIFFSYTFIPLSTIAFPHITIFCLTAQADGAVPPHDRLLSALHPGDLAAVCVPRRRRQRHARRPADCEQARGAAGAGRPRRRRCPPTSAPRSAGRRPATMSCRSCSSATRRSGWPASWRGHHGRRHGSDSQILALSTMFTEDVFAFYGGKARFGEDVQVQTGVSSSWS